MESKGRSTACRVWLVVGLAAALHACTGGGEGGGSGAAPRPTDSAEAVAREAADYFLKGDYKQGFQHMEKLGEQPLTRILGRDMQALVDRVQAALAKATEASAHFQAGDF